MYLSLCIEWEGFDLKFVFFLDGYIGSWFGGAGYNEQLRWRLLVSFSGERGRVVAL